MFSGGLTNVQFVINTPDTLEYVTTIDHTPWITGNPQLTKRDTIKTINKNVILNIPANLTSSIDLNSTFYNTFYFIVVR